MFKLDVLGHKYDDSEPAFTAVESGMYYYHLKTKRLLGRASFDKFLADNDIGFADGELGIPSDGLIAISEDMLKNLFTPTVPTAPTTLGVTAVSDTELDLDWTDNSDNEAGFRIERSPNLADTFVEIGSVAAGETTFSDTDLTPDTAYDYEVFAVNVTGDSTAATGTGTTDA